MKEVKIKDFDKWSALSKKEVPKSKVSGENYEATGIDPERAQIIEQLNEKVSERVGKLSKKLEIDVQYDTKKNVLRMKQQIKVTYHRIDLFKDMYSEYFRS